MLRDHYFVEKTFQAASFPLCSAVGCQDSLQTRGWAKLEGVLGPKTLQWACAGRAEPGLNTPAEELPGGLRGSPPGVRAPRVKTLPQR